LLFNIEGGKLAAVCEIIVEQATLEIVLTTISNWKQLTSSIYFIEGAKEES
jgi:hypothetical protein